MSRSAVAEKASDVGTRQKYDRLIARAKALRPLKTAVVHPCDVGSVGALIEAHSLGLIDPILVGPPSKIADAAAEIKADLTTFEIVGAAHSHDAADKAVALVKAGRAQALMKGSLHTDELMGAVVRRDGL